MDNLLGLLKSLDLKHCHVNSRPDGFISFNSEIFVFTREELILLIEKIDSQNR